MSFGKIVDLNIILSSEGIRDSMVLLFGRCRDSFDCRISIILSGKFMAVSDVTMGIFIAVRMSGNPVIIADFLIL